MLSLIFIEYSISWVSIVEMEIEMEVDVEVEVASVLKSNTVGSRELKKRKPDGGIPDSRFQIPDPRSHLLSSTLPYLKAKGLHEH